MKKAIQIVCVAAAYVSVVSSASVGLADQMAPGIELLGKAPGTNYSRAAAVSDDGTAVAVNCRSFTFSGHEVAVWTQSGGLTPLVDSNANPQAGIATAISGDGLTVVGIAGGTSTAFRWTQGAGVQKLYGVESRTPSEAWDVSADGSIVIGLGYAALTGSNTTACLWDADGLVQNIGTLGSDTSSIASKVSADGRTILGYSGNWGDREPFEWTEQTGIVPGAYVPNAASPSLSRVVFRTGTEPNVEWFLWTEGTGVAALGSLPGSTIDGPRDVSETGVVIGNSSSSDPAWIWTPDDGIWFLDDYLTQIVGLDLNGMSIREAYGITPDGMTIVGMASNTPEGYSQAYIIDLPEPATLGMLALGGLAVIRRRRRR